MTIWILAILLLASAAGMGLRQGAIRVVISFVGIIISALLAWPLSALLLPVLPHLGIQNPFIVKALAPFLVFIILLSLFKSLGLLVHHKVNVHYKYHADDLQLILWERLNKRLGLCLGPLNGLLYLVLVSVVVYDLSYWTVQVAPSDNERLTIRLLNRMGRDLQDTGLIQAAQVIDPLPEIYFQSADLAGLIYQNPQLLDRLSAYPAFLSLSERDDFKQLGQNADFQNAWKSRAPIGQLLDNPQAKVIWENWTKSMAILDLVLTNFDDLNGYLQTGRSAKYDPEPLLGRWDFNVMYSLTALAQTQSNFPSSSMAAMRVIWSQAYSNTVFVAGADGTAFLKNLPQFKPQASQQPSFDSVTWSGQWKTDGNGFDVTLANGGANKAGTATVDGSRLTLQTAGDTYIFDRE